MGVRGAILRTLTIFKHPHARYSNRALLAYGVQYYGFFQNHVCWPMGYRGIVIVGATPEPKYHFVALWSSNTPISGTQKHLFWLVGYRQRCLGYHSRTQPFFFGMVQFKPHPRYLKNPFTGLWDTLVRVFRVPPQNPTNIVWHCAVETPPS